VGTVLSDKDPESEIAHKVVAIMQTISEDLDDTGKKAWLKLLGLSDSSKTETDSTSESQSDQDKDDMD